MMTKKPQSKFRWPIAVEKTIEAPASGVWEVISTPGILELCHPYCAKNPVLVWPGPDSHDEVHYLSGWVFERRFRQWTDGTGYDLDIGKPGGKTSSVSWRIRPVGSDSCVLRITIYPYVLKNMPTVIGWLPQVVWLQPMLRKYLASVVSGFEWYVSRGEPVPRDKFGRHPWFSASEPTAG